MLKCYFLACFLMFFFPPLCFQMVHHQKESLPGRTRFLHTVSSVHPLHWDHLQPLLHSRPGLKPNPVGTLAQPWQLPCSNSFLSMTPKLRPFQNTRTLLLLWMRRFRDNLLQPGLQIRHLNLLLKHQQGSWHLCPQLWDSSPKTRTSAFPMEPPTHLQSLSEAALCVWAAAPKGRTEKAQQGHVIHWTVSRENNAGSKRKWMSFRMRSRSRTWVPVEQAVVLDKAWTWAQFIHPVSAHCYTC